MFTVVNEAEGTIYADCPTFNAAVRVAVGLRLFEMQRTAFPAHFVVRQGDEIKFHTLRGRTE